MLRESTVAGVLKDVKRLVENSVRTLEGIFKYNDVSNRNFGGKSTEKSILGLNKITGNLTQTPKFSPNRWFSSWARGAVANLPSSTIWSALNLPSTRWKQVINECKIDLDKDDSNSRN